MQNGGRHRDLTEFLLLLLREAMFAFSLRSSSQTTLPANLASCRKLSTILAFLGKGLPVEKAAPERLLIAISADNVSRQAAGRRDFRQHNGGVRRGR
jgi:hypothetical protein